MNLAGFGLASAVSWGGSDFLGGLGSRRAPAPLVVAAGQIVSLLLLVGFLLLTGQGMPHDRVLWFAVAGGFEGSLSLMLFYRALAMGAMGLTAALAGLLTALLPVAYALVRDGLPGPLVLAGLGVGLAAIWLITRTPTGAGERTPTRALLLGAVAGCGFGLQLILFKWAAGCGLIWIMTSARGAGVVAMLLALLIAPIKVQSWRGFWALGVAAGLLDSLGNVLYICATKLGRLDIAAMLGALYPAVTILLAAVALRERPTGRQIAGMVLALAAVALLSW
jgi:drug/metabolite transporter (DMT)-like permease